ncbi:MAG TPA: superoxide dismutase [Gammaproteobacteria bacterium]|nr:superoxide dismutase [Gammaproteobacteria bacterium]
MPEQSQPFALPPLPWAENALSPAISKNTIEFHYGKHHQAYVNNLNKLVAGTDLADLSLEDLVRRVVGKADKTGVFNNGAQVWNHTFYWNSLSPEKAQPSSALRSKLDESFGGLDQFKQQFAQAAGARFGSGWAWLVADGGKLAIETTSNADTPMAHGKHCLLTVDVWEHAYYLDYQNRRPDYLKSVLDSVLNWRFASEQYEAA